MGMTLLLTAGNKRVASLESRVCDMRMSVAFGDTVFSNAGILTHDPWTRDS